MVGRASLLLQVGAALVAGATLGVAQAPQAERPTFEAGIDVVNLNVSVRDGRHFVGGLAQGDFAVYEDGIPQDVSLFINRRLPISLVLMVDSSSSMRSKLEAARRAGASFLRTLRAGDRAQVIGFNVDVQVLTSFTDDQAQLEDALARLRARGPTALHNALYVALKGLAKQRDPQGPRRRAIVLLSDGEDTASLVRDEQIIELARQSEVGIYAISLRMRPPVDGRQKGFSQASYLLSTLARESGGRAFFPQSLSELDAVYERIAEELRTLYSIGYVSNNRRRDGKWRRIVVRIPSREGLEIRYKVGYFGPPG